jgi:hypothetical protein
MSDSICYAANNVYLDFNASYQRNQKGKVVLRMPDQGYNRMVAVIPEWFRCITDCEILTAGDFNNGTCVTIMMDQLYFYDDGIKFEWSSQVVSENSACIRYEEKVVFGFGFHNKEATEKRQMTNS